MPDASGRSTTAETPRSSNGGRTNGGASGGEASLVLRDEHGAVSRCRRFVAEQLERAGLPDVAADAELVASEMVTNALLHAGPPVEMNVQLAPPKARVEVRDSCAIPPVRPRRTTEDMTGRGLHIVEALACAWGVAPLDGGKAVWAELEAGAPRGQPELDEDTLIAMWAADDGALGDSVDDEVFTVYLGDVPTELLVAAKAHVDNLVREFTLAASGADHGATATVPRELAQLIEAVVHRFADARQTIKHQALAAANAGEDQVRLELTLPMSAAQAGEEYLRALDEADAYCREARLLTLEAPPQHRIFRRWYVEQLIDQLRRAGAGAPVETPEPFEERLLREVDRSAPGRAER